MTRSATVEGTQRIPVQAVGECKTWQLPEISGERVVYQTTADNPEHDTLALHLTKFTPQGNITPAQPTKRSRLTGAELEQLVASAEAEAGQRGYEEGVQQGLLAGKAEGLEQGLQNAGEQLAALQATVGEINARLPSVIDLHNVEMQNAVVELVGNIAAAVVQRELSVDGSALQQCINTALAAISVADKAVTVFVSEGDYQRLTDEDAFATRDWQLAADAALVSGDCRILTRHASVDYTVAERLEQALSALYADFSATPAPPVATDNRAQ